jgi:hypothetical protein
MLLIMHRDSNLNIKYLYSKYFVENPISVPMAIETLILYVPEYKITTNTCAKIFAIIDNAAKMAYLIDVFMQ